VSTIARTLLTACAVNAALCIAPARATDLPATRPGDEAMGCEQIATELSTYARQMVPNLQALGASEQQLYAQGRQRGEQRKAEEALLLPLAEAGALDPTGASKRAYQAALMAQMAKERSEDQAFANSPLAKQNRAQTEQLAAQAQQMHSDVRLQRLMELGHEKGCDKR
jgi:hypothetical protein